MSEPEEPPDPRSGEQTQEPTSGDMRRTQRGLAPRYLALEQEPASTASQEPKTKRGFGAALKLMRSLPLGRAPQAPAPIVVPSLAQTDRGWGPNNTAQGPKTLRGFRFVENRELARDQLPPQQPDERTIDAPPRRVGPPPLAPHLRARAPQPSAANTPGKSDGRETGLAETLCQSPASVARALTLQVLADAAREPVTAREHSQTIIVTPQEPNADPGDIAGTGDESGEFGQRDPRARDPHTEQMVWGLRTRRPGLADSDVDRLAGAFRWTAIATHLFDERNARDAAASARGERQTHRLAIALGAALVVALAFGAVYPTRVSVRAPAVLQAASAPQPLAAKASGTVRGLNVAVGDEVQAAHVLLTLDDAALDAQRTAAARELERANQRTHELEEARGAHERKAQELRVQVESTEQTVRVESARVKKLRERRAALEGLDEQGSVVEKSIAVLSLEITGAEEETRALELELSRAQLQLASFERERSEQLQSAGADLDAAQRASASADALLERTQLRAPSAGRIQELSARVGDAVQAGQKLVQLGTLAPPTHAVAFVAARDRAALRVGQTVQLELDRRVLHASVEDIAARPETNGTHRVELALQHSDPELRAGTAAKLMFTAKRGPALLRWLAPLRGLFEQ